MNVIDVFVSITRNNTQRERSTMRQRHTKLNRIAISLFGMRKYLRIEREKEVVTVEGDKGEEELNIVGCNVKTSSF